MFDYINKLYRNVGQVEILEKVETTTSIRRREITKAVVRSLVDTANIKSILEIGPASGYITQGICEILEEKNRVKFDILDFSDSFIQTTKRRDLHINNAHIADIASVDFHIGGQYDLILCQEVIEHLTCPYVAVNNINGILNSNGYLFLTLPNASYYRNLLKAIKLTKTKRGVSVKDTHIAELSVLGVIKLLSMSGFEIIETFYYSSATPFLDVLLSEQVGFLSRKVSSPKDCWSELEARILRSWQEKNV